MSISIKIVLAAVDSKSNLSKPKGKKKRNVLVYTTESCTWLHILGPSHSFYLHFLFLCWSHSIESLDAFGQDGGQRSYTFKSTEII